MVRSLLLTTIAAAALLVSFPRTSAGRNVPDSVRVAADLACEAARHLLDSGDADAAMARFQAALALDPDHAPALVGVGKVHLQRGDLKAAEKAFMAARRKDRKYAPAHDGLGLVYMQKKKGLRWAIQYFQDAVAADRDYDVAYYHMAEAYRKLGDTKELVAYKRLARIRPDHPDVWFQIGRIYKEGEAGEYIDLEEAEEALRRQLEVNPDHLEASVLLGEALKELGKTDEAVAVLRPLVERPNPYRRNALLELAEVHQKRREFERAGELFDAYIASVPPEEQALFYDLSLVATGADLDRFRSAPRSEWKELSAAFWAGRDPAPITAANERLLEHYRRVAYALEHFGEFQQPWDDRGEVYIRYGRPDHVSRSDNISFEMEPKVLAVKERLIRQAGSALTELMKVRNFETTSYDGQVGDLADPQPLGPMSETLRESAETGSHRTDDGWTTDPLPGGGRATGQAGMDAHMRSESSILGWPVYPVVGKVWEYWIYTDVGPGVEITFTQQLSRAPFRFADMPTGKGGHTNTLYVWQRMNPALVMHHVITRTPDVYRPDFATAPLEFFFDVARFRGGAQPVQLEVYFGIPNWDLTFVEAPEGGQEVRLTRGVALYGPDDQPVFRASSPVKLTADAATDTSRHAYIPEVAVVPAAPGTYRLSVQLRDDASGRSQVYNQELTLNPFGERYLRVSDIELAAAIGPATGGPFTKGDVEVVPNPTRTFYPGQSVFVYYEIYNLERDTFGATRYRVSYEVRSLDQGSVAARIVGGLGRLLGIRQDTSEKVSIEYEHTGQTDTDYGYLELDMSNSEPGDQILRVHVSDEVAGAASEASTTFTIRR